MANESTLTIETPSRAGLISQKFLVSFSSVQTEETASGPGEVTYHTLYEIWRFSDGNGGSYENLYQLVTRDGAHCDTKTFHGGDAQSRIKKIREEIQSEVEITDIDDKSLCVRFFDVNRPVDDLPEISYDGKTWVPYAGVRDRASDTPGYSVEYHEEDSGSAQTPKRIGKPNGRKISLLTKPDPVRSSFEDPNSRKGEPMSPANPYKKL